MTHEKLVRTQRILLGGTIVSLPFMVVPHLPFSSSLVSYFLLLGIVTALWDMKKEGTFQCIPKRYWQFIGVFFIWSFVCMIIGVYTYPFYSTINMGDSSKLISLLSWLKSHQIDVSHESALQVWLTLRFTKDLFFDIVMVFGGTLWIYSLYHHNWRQGFRDIRKSVLVLTCLLCVYSIIEIAYLMGNDTAAYLLKVINTLYMDVKSSHGWWPPLLWEKQLRSLFPEPSYFGIVSTVIIPVLCSYLLEKKCFKISVLYVFYMVMLFLTRARTATGLFLGEMVLFIIACWGYCRNCRQRMIGIVLCGILSFFFSITVILPGNTNESVLEKSGSYMTDSITSVSGNQRSNVARKSNVMATFMVGVEHPILGVGHNLKDAYLLQNLSEESLQNYEVNLWKKTMEEKGVLKSGFPTLNKLATVFAESGVVGCLLYLVPFFYVIVQVFRKKLLKNNIEVVCLTIALIGSMAAFFSNAEFWSIYVILGLLLCVVDGESHET